MTNGALQVIRSNTSPATGSKRLPARVSTLSIPFSAALSAVKASARGLTSVATTRSACAADRAEACRRKPPRVHGDVAVAGRVRVLAEQLVHGVLRVADPAERRAQGPCGREIDDRVHGDTVSECRDSLLGVQSTQRSTC